MSPSVFFYKSYRFFFYSREESRKHVHVVSTWGESKFWLEPAPEQVKNRGHTRSQIKELMAVIEEHRHEFIAAWQHHFKHEGDPGL